MDLENQQRVKDIAEANGPENVVIVLGGAEGEAAGLAAETVTAGEPEIKEEVDPDIYDEQVSMMEMVLDVDDIISEMTSIREQFCQYC